MIARPDPDMVAEFLAAAPQWAGAVTPVTLDGHPSFIFTPFALQEFTLWRVERGLSTADNANALLRQLATSVKFLSPPIVGG